MKDKKEETFEFLGEKDGFLSIYYWGVAWKIPKDKELKGAAKISYYKKKCQDTFVSDIAKRVKSFERRYVAWHLWYMHHCHQWPLVTSLFFICQMAQHEEKYSPKHRRKIVNFDKTVLRRTIKTLLRLYWKRSKTHLNYFRGDKDLQDTLDA